MGIIFGSNSIQLDISRLVVYQVIRIIMPENKKIINKINYARK